LLASFSFQKKPTGCYLFFSSRGSLVGHLSVREAADARAFSRYAPFSAIASNLTIHLLSIAMLPGGGATQVQSLRKELELNEENFVRLREMEAMLEEDIEIKKRSIRIEKKCIYQRSYFAKFKAEDSAKTSLSNPR
jgi:hypothetical protein